ncbi:MAG: hypothetical protein EOS07_03225 [Mesorhizobium sp.]|uniref:hypothetical protein n=1 Tax=Mesorhizobium sp. TaxID=1871066 RepID=UPI000FE69645|nr:hypothetical protein [Mesorhizobium sp.]RWB07680.1 MAG: hypothetical protein EOQ33_02895 [Mesorhizobium sp.]RWO13686.1 MAG: hypothetical protein EOS07_03225 [Mesorhizobium sp.]RWO20238.1 MAG: hypothetical protein EOS08_21710 [Mesorhizobium sp.]RWP05355.1 MAG: hypothetical protein EOQ99_15305 [Mesorhizobium sp.]RWQ06695.1 MAG: hypothetical protein EOR89_03950 [Mesorhizobium sp.]
MPSRRSILEKAKAADLRPQGVDGKRLQKVLDRAKKFFKRPSRHADESVKRHASLMAQSVERRDWQAAREHALALGLLGEQLGDRGLVKKAGRGLRRLRGGNRAWQLIASSKQVPGRPEWDGSDLAGRRLVVERREGDLAIFLQFASLLGPVVAAADRCTVLIEPRLAPLYRRTYPALDVRPEAEAAAAVDADVFACFETLARHFWPDEPTARAPFVPLEPDRRLVAELRGAYLDHGPGPLIGFAWGSLNKSKDLPVLDDWRALLGGLPGHFVSMQYGDVGPALSEFERWAPGRIIHDASVDQLSDMDRFAAQIAALDAVVTISNTGANLAGALGVPTVVLLDDGFRLSWPAFGETVATYPSVRLMRKGGRAWASAMREAGGRVAQIIGGVGDGS